MSEVTSKKPELTARDKIKKMLDICCELLGLGEYAIYWRDSEPRIKGAIGEIRLNLAHYLSLSIVIDCAQHADDRALMDTVLHECIHAAMTPLALHQKVMRKAIPKELRKPLDKSYTHADETVTVRLTRALLDAVWESYEELLESEQEEESNE